MRTETEDLQRAQIEQAIEPILGEDTLDGAALADRAALSRFHFQRVFKRILGETPGELRRRLLLERAAHALATTNISVTEIAFAAGYESLEGFIRGFRKAFGCSPSAYRSGPVRSFAVRAPNDVHFAALGSLVQGETKMDFLDQLLEQDAWMMKRLLEHASKLSDEELDRSIVSSQSTPWEGEQTTLRQVLDSIVFTQEVWVAAVEKEGIPEERDKSAQGMLRRYELAHAMFAGVARRVRDQNQWDTTFVDELCEPPETFTFGGMISHVMTFGIHRRTLAFDALRRLGVADAGYGEPIEWDRFRRGEPLGCG